MTTSTDRIEKQILLRAPQARVWRALTDAAEFGTWFRAKLDGRFVAGEVIRGHITYPGYEHLQIALWIERLEPETLFSLRWHPHAVEADRDYTGEPTTLVELRLEAVDGGTRLTVTESGFDQIPEERRALAFRMNEGGWAAQLENIEAHVAG